MSRDLYSQMIWIPHTSVALIDQSDTFMMMSLTTSGEENVRNLEV